MAPAKSAKKHDCSSTRRRWGRVLSLLLPVLVLLALAPTACGSDRPATKSSLDTGQRVQFTSSDGIELTGHVFGEGSRGVVLAHMYPADQTSWFDQAAAFAQAGFAALTFDFRGYGESGGQKDIASIYQDVLAAMACLGQREVTDVVLVGASMGGTAALVAAAELANPPRQDATPLVGPPAGHLPTVHGLVTLSAPVAFKGLSAEEAVPRLTCSLLFLAAEKDVGAEEARRLKTLAPSQAELLIVPGEEHGTDLLSGSQGPLIWQTILDFVRDWLQG